MDNDINMNFETIEQGLGIVILGQFNPQQTNVDWLIGRQIVKAEEREMTRQDVVNANVSVFNVGNIRVLCDKARLQVGTTDVVMIPRMLSFCRDLLNTVEVDSFRGIGINPHLVIKPTSAGEEELIESRMLPPMAVWQSLCDGGQVGTITVKSGNKTISMVRAPHEEGRFAYSFNVNIHCELQGIADIITTIENAQQGYNTEISQLDAIIRSI